MENFYITTAIDYVNGAPHIGHAYEKIYSRNLPDNGHCNFSNYSRG